MDSVIPEGDSPQLIETYLTLLNAQIQALRIRFSDDKYMSASIFHHTYLPGKSVDYIEQ